MSTQVATQNSSTVDNQSQGAGRRGGNRGRTGANRGQNRAGRGARNGGGQRRSEKAPGKEKESTTKDETEPAPKPVANTADTDDSEETDTEICFICAEPVKYYSVSECNHRTCHVCALRLRALYKKTECTFCKEPQLSVVFTRSADALFSSYTAESIPHKDAKLSISFETREMMEETLILLRFNCPDPNCDYIGNGWGDLKLHTRANHGKLMCDLCIRFKKVFAHEHALYAPNMLPFHLPSMLQRGSKAVAKDQIEGGVHPLCEFCRECFFSGDELYAHMRERHEECFICKRNEVRDQYFQNYDSLERHFNTAHFPCRQSQCQARKFVVFNTTLDLQAHMVEEHGADMSSRDKKDARRIQAEFQFEEVGGRHGHGRRGGGDRDRDREPPGRQQPPGAAGPSRPTGAPGSGARRREAFNTTLTGDNSPQGGSGGATTPAVPNRTPQPSRPASPPKDDVDPAIAERHAAFMSRLQSLAPNPTTAIPAVKAAARSYRASESSARDFISTIWTILDQNLENTASIVNAFVDLLDEEDKKQDLLASWKGFAIEQRRQFPELLPTAVGAGYAGITSGRVLNAKHATATRSSQQSSNQVWDRVAEAASSSSSTIFRPPPPRPAIARKKEPPPPSASFPSLSSTAASSSTTTTPFRQGQRNTPWSQSGGGFRPPEPRIQVVPAVAQSSSLGSNAPRRPPPKMSNTLFPELPSSGNASRSKPPVSGNVSLRNILGNSAPAAPAWKSGGGGGDANATTAEPSAESEQAQAGGKGKKGKGKQKQTLFTLGSFPN